MTVDRWVLVALAWAVGALMMWAFVHVGTRDDPDDWDDEDDGIQPWDTRTQTLASGGSWTYTERPN